MNISDISYSEYLNLTEDQKQEFYKKVLADSPGKNSPTTAYYTATNLSKQARAPEPMSHQENGKLSFVAPLKRKDKNISSLFFLTLCDCGNYAILEGPDYRKEKRIQCPFCSAKRTTMKDITGEVFGQLQAIYPTDERGKDGSVYWMCRCIDCGHQQKVIKTNLSRPQGHLCACCGQKSKGEYKISTMLKDLNIPFEKEYSFKDCFFPDSHALARFDFFVNEEYIIEVDGQHHFYPIDFGGHFSDEEKNKMFNKVKQHDLIKNNYCISHHIPIIRIPYMSINYLTYEDLDKNNSKFLVY